MLERVQRKGNPLTLLVRMQTGTATMENSVEISLKKLEIELPYDPAIPLLGIHTEETRIERNTCNISSQKLVNRSCSPWSRKESDMTEQPNNKILQTLASVCPPDRKKGTDLFFSYVLHRWSHWILTITECGGRGSRYYFSRYTLRRLLLSYHLV